MTIRDDLHEEGIALRSYGPGDYKTLCPKCSHTRKKKKDPCLSVTVHEDHAIWKCHNCAWAGRVPQGQRAEYQPRQRKAKPRRPDYKPSKLTEKMIEWFQRTRGISRPVVERNGISIGDHWMPGAGKEVQTLQFPYFRQGQVVNVKYRDNQKNFCQEKGAEKVFYGLDDIADTDWCVIVEGEFDKLACEEAGIRNVISVPDGAPAQVREGDVDPEDDAKFEYVWNCKAELDRMQKIVLAVDADAPGQALEEELARRLGRHRCWRVAWPSLNDVTLKDANEVLLQEGAAVLAECIAEAEPFPVVGLWDVDHYRADVLRLYHEGEAQKFSTGWPLVDELFQIRGGEVTIVTGLPGSGKSELIDALLVNLANLHGWGFALCSFENPPHEHIAKLAEKKIAAPFGEGPSMRMSPTELETAMAWLEQHFHFIRADDDSPTMDWILERATAAVMRYGIRGLVIDPYNEIEHKRESGMTETEYVSMILSKVRRWAASHDAHVWFVAHPAKMQRTRDGKVPLPSLGDISGSAHWRNKADIGMVIERHYEPGRENETTIHITKVRFKAVGQVGSIVMEYERRTGRYDASRRNYRDC